MLIINRTATTEIYNDIDIKINCLIKIQVKRVIKINLIKVL